MINPPLGFQTSFRRVLDGLASWPAPELTSDGIVVPTHCLYPSNSVVNVKVEGHENFFVHDQGGAMDEMEAACAPVPNAARLIVHIVRPYGLDVSKEGAIYATQVSAEELASTIVLVANASKEAAQYLIERYRPPHRDMRGIVEQILDLKFRNQWKRNLRIVGASSKSHRFDYIVNLPKQRQLLLDAVVPEPSSINAAVVAHLDVKQSEDAKQVDQRIVYDDAVEWTAADLSLLRVGARPVPVSNLRETLERLAA
jgi:hypothetical protein